MNNNLTLDQLKAALAAAAAEGHVALALPDGRRVPAHYHVTEVGHIQKDFVDCGGKWRASKTCVLQTWMSSARDDGHRLTAGRLLKILTLADRLFSEDAVPVEVEYEDGLISQFPLISATDEDGDVVLHLGLKHTDCLARKPAPDAAETACGCGCGSPDTLAAGKSCC
jgi:hypothetical protein